MNTQNIKIGDILILNTDWTIQNNEGKPDMIIEKGRRFEVEKVFGNCVKVTLAGKEDRFFFDFIEANFTIKTPTTWTPKQKEKVLVRDFEDGYDWEEKVFEVFLNGKYYCHHNPSGSNLYGWKYCKPYNPPIPYLSEIEALIQKE